MSQRIRGITDEEAIGTVKDLFDASNQLLGRTANLQRILAHSLLNQIEGVTCTMPKGALYLFPKLDVRRFNIQDDERFAFDLLRQEKILVVQGTGFNWPEPDHFRIVFLPREEELIEAIGRLGEFLATYRQ